MHVQIAGERFSIFFPPYSQIFPPLSLSMFLRSGTAYLLRSKAFVRWSLRSADSFSQQAGKSRFKPWVHVRICTNDDFKFYTKTARNVSVIKELDICKSFFICLGIVGALFAVFVSVFRVTYSFSYCLLIRQLASPTISHRFSASTLLDERESELVAMRKSSEFRKSQFNERILPRYWGVEAKKYHRSID